MVANILAQQPVVIARSILLLALLYVTNIWKISKNNWLGQPTK